MRFLDTIKLALRALLRNRMRTFLTMLGIIIGISSVIIMMSLGTSLTAYMQKGFSAIGNNVIEVHEEWDRSGGVWVAMRPITQGDYDVLKRDCRHIAAISPSVDAGTAVVFGNNNHNSYLEGVNRDYLVIGNLSIGSGTMFTDEDIATYAKVCVIGETVVEKLFTHGENPVGQTIRCGDVPMLVVGVLARRDPFMGNDMNDRMLAPYTTVQKRFLGSTDFSSIAICCADQRDNELAVAEITRVLRQYHGLTKDDPDDFRIRLLEDAANQLNQILAIVVLVLSLIAGISLVVGGVGIMNIMYVIVTERTREIGLRKAIGARRRDIMTQFLLESVVMSLVGGVFGVLLGIGIYALVTLFVGEMPFVVNGNAILISFTVCSLIGVFFGWYPARKAANLDPIQAIRYE